ncbi:CRP-like cAMP-binding protein [Caulobacter ginsengisoli]|uniref:CRP-like cAMP-binding protein n=1 Tax=Caulobacter ginsengisoli TaxID=400775 RepID=A0ABU0IPF3_9CAUL|nr:Crp/Fnr family transcriptional regulator [Caulobacter ginsengisoli]MDQ0463305.1 CRP-like cAMP-binding protein [Caulobacter ginsengisoli]
MNPPDEDQRRSLMAIPWFAGQAPEQAAALIKAGRLIRRGAGEWLHGEGDEETGLLAVLEGRLKLYCQAPGEREVMIAIMPPGAVMGQSATFGGGPRLLTVIAAADSIVFTLSDRALRQAAADHPGVWRDLAGLLYLQLSTILQLVAVLTALPPRARLAARLLQLEQNLGVADVSQGDLAEMVGVTRKAINGWLGEMARKGWVRLGYGRVEILKPAALRGVVAG